MALESILEARRRKWPVALYTHRISLTEQTGAVLGEHLDVGYRAAGFDRALLRDVQICSIQTEGSQVLKKGRRELHQAKLVIVDEAHAIKAETAQKVLKAHQAAGAKVIGYTATPLGLEKTYERLLVAATNSELRRAGILATAVTYAPDEPDLERLSARQQYEISQAEAGKLLFGEDFRPAKVLFGRVYEHWRRLNPSQRPTILFAPGVRESMWLVDRFVENGVPAGHIDAENVYYGERNSEGPILHPSSRDERLAILSASRRGDIKVLCNRFVAREGLDLPWLGHGVLATIFGGLSSYIQAGGRLLRSDGGRKKEVVVQDHGGNAWRHGSLNADRDWALADTDESIASRVSKSRKEGDGKAPEPITCPKCSFVRMRGPECPACHHKHVRSVRVLIQVDGTLKKKVGAAIKKLKRADKPEYIVRWDSIFWMGMKSRQNMGMDQLAAIYQKQTGKEPPYGQAWNCPKADSPKWDQRVRQAFPRREKARTV